MSDRLLWYVRRGGKVAGPFPTQIVSSNALLGRFLPSDEVSLDQSEWRPLVAVRELLPQELLELQSETDPEHKQWLEERFKAARRWADERTHEDRRHQEANGGREIRDDGQRKEERRKNRANPDVLALPHQHAAAVEESGKRRYFGVALGLGAALLLLVLGLVYFQPVNPVKVGVMPEQPQCQQPAAPRANWSGCDKQEIRLRGADLRGSNLTYADFSHADLSGSSLHQAKLVGANFNNADLNHADLGGADMSYCDLRGANLISADLTGTVLDQAIWPDGRVCAAGSLGLCR